MLRDLIISLSVSCLCFILMIVMHSFSVQPEINLLLSTVVLSWALLQFVERRAFFQTSIAVTIAILLMLQQYQQIFWMGVGLLIALLLYRLPYLKQTGASAAANSVWNSSISASPMFSGGAMRSVLALAALMIRPRL